MSGDVEDFDNGLGLSQHARQRMHKTMGLTLGCRQPHHALFGRSFRALWQSPTHPIRVDSLLIAFAL